MRRNLFIALEGIDGSGKSTQVRLLGEAFERAGQKVYTTFEPTDSRIGQMIRDIFNHKMEADHRTIAGLFVADRLHHLLNPHNGMLKMLEEGYVVITDRYYFSSYAYHSVHMPMDWVIQANALAADLLRPDLTIYIDLPPEVSMERIALGRTSMEMYETVENLRQVRDKYMEAFERLKGKEDVLIVKGDRQPEAIAREVWEAVSARIGVVMKGRSVN